MRFLNTDGSAADDAPEPAAGRGARVLPRDKIAVIEAGGSTPVVIKTPDAELVLEPGGDYLVVAQEQYLRLVTELRVFKDYERRALDWTRRRHQRREDRASRP